MVSTKPDDAKMAKGYVIVLLILVIGIPLLITFSTYVVPTIWVHNYITYKSHDGWSTVSEILQKKSGVCREYAVLLLWKLNMRQTNLMIVKRKGDDSTHAVVLVGDSLVLDPTRMTVHRFGYFYNQFWEVVKIVPYNKINSYVGRSVL